MISSSTTDNIAHPFLPVKSPLNSQLPLLPDSMIHHKVTVSRKGNSIVSYSRDRKKDYGVSSSNRLLSPALLMKKWDYVCDCLRLVLGLTNKQQQVVLKLLRFWAYYGPVFPKAATLGGERKLLRAEEAELPPETAQQRAWVVEMTPEETAGRACLGLGYPTRRGEIGRATVWRTIAILKELGLLSVVNRYVLRPHAQISNLYRMDKLLIVIAKYLAEHTGRIWPDWFDRYLFMPWPVFWAVLPSEGDTLSPGYRVPPAQQL